MSQDSFFVVLPFARGSGGSLMAEDPIGAADAETAMALARSVSESRGGAVVFVRNRDQATGRDADVAVLFRAGDVPDDVSGYMLKP